MKKLLVCVFMAMFSFGASAQILKFGLRAGVNGGTISADDLRIVVSDSEELRAKAGDYAVGFHVGAMAQINIPSLPLMVIPEILFTSTGGEVIVGDINEIDDTRLIYEDQKFGRLDIPVMLAYKIGVARLQVGPVASFVLSENNGLLDAVREAGGEVVQNVEEQGASTATFGFQAGVGVNVRKKVAIDVKYEGGLSSYGEGVVLSGQDFTFDSRPSQLILSVGYLF